MKSFRLYTIHNVGGTQIIFSCVAKHRLQRMNCKCASSYFVSMHSGASPVSICWFPPFTKPGSIFSTPLSQMFYCTVWIF